jgi:ABC-2 type transport system ATP-binding protein
MEPIITLTDIHKYYGSKHVLQGINLKINPGQIIGYIGPNGAGKSTTVKILCGLISEFDGTVIVDGFNIKQDALQVKKIIGYVPELAEMYEVLTPREFLFFTGSLYGLNKEVIEKRATGMLSAFGMLSNLNQRMDTFSKGMKQKVLLVSGILHDPKIIILDEPLSGLDANSVIIVKELISRLAREGKTIFYSSHIMDIVEKVSDRIILISQGKVLADGTIEDLRHHQGNASLEKIFSQLTSTESPSQQADQLMNLFEK